MGLRMGLCIKKGGAGALGGRNVEARLAAGKPRPNSAPHDSAGESC